MALADLVYETLGPELEAHAVSVHAYDGSHVGSEPSITTVDVRSPDALSRVVTRPGELGFVRAYVAGDIDIIGDIFAVLEVGFEEKVHLGAAQLAHLLPHLRQAGLRWLPPPPEEARLRGHLHSRARDASAISHHYDVSNEFYRLLLGPSLTYSCAVFADPVDSLETAQANKYELVCAKLGLRPGMRLLDVGCGWGGLLMHAAGHHGVTGVGITLSRQQATLASKRVAEAGLTDCIEIRVQDYRDVTGRFDAVASIGMFEHVGRSQLDTYCRRLADIVEPGGRVLNHGICRPAYPQPPTPLGRTRTLYRRLATAAGARWPSRIDSPLMDRYVFPDGELHEVATVAALIQQNGLEVRHVENLREHYALTLRRWVANLEQRWEEAVALIGERRARVWRLYLAASALGFEHHRIEIHQILAVRLDGGRSAMPLRPDW